MGLVLAWPYVTNRFFPTEKTANSISANSDPKEPKAASDAKLAPVSAETPKAAQKAAAATEAAAPSVKLPELVPVVLENEFASFKIDPNTASVSEITLNKIKTADRKSAIGIGGKGYPANAFDISGLDGWTLVDCKALQASGSKDSVTVERSFRKGAESLKVSESFKLGASYLLSCTMTLSNGGSAAFKIPALAISAGGLPPLHWLSGDKVFNDPHRVEFCLSANKHVRSFDPSIADEKFKAERTVNPLDWVGSSNKYFTMLLALPEGTAFGAGNAISREESSGNDDGKAVNYFIPAISGVFKEIALAPGEKTSFDLNLYAGPKEASLLKALLPPSAQDVLHLSYWSWFEFLARPLLWLLNFLHSYCGSYGVSIILLTLIVRIVFWPATQAANNSMRKMQKVKPLMDSIKEKYKGDTQTMNAKMMELYKKEKINPLGGCLPLLLQLPVFFALYSTLDAAVELRQIPFLWATDLSRPDLVGPVLLFGLGIHPFIIMMTILMFIQQKLTPTMGDPMQQKIMMAMPLVMLVMLYSLPSGLTLYWTVSNAFSIIQLIYTLNLNKRDEAKQSLKSKPA